MSAKSYCLLPSLRTAFKGTCSFPTTISVLDAHLVTKTIQNVHIHYFRSLSQTWKQKIVHKVSLH